MIHAGIHPAVHARSSVALLSSLFLLLSFEAAKAEPVEVSSRDARPPVSAGIAERLARQVTQEKTQTREAEAQGLEPRKLGRLWAHLASVYQDQGDFSSSENAYNRALRLFEPLPEAKVDYAVVLDNLGSLYLMEHRVKDAYQCRQRALALREELGDRLEIARGKAHVAELDLMRHRYSDARQKSQEAYTTMVELHDKDAADMIGALSTLVFAECSRGNCPGALDHARAAADLARVKDAPDSVTAAHAHLLLGFAEWKTGAKEDAEDEIRQGIAMMRTQTPPGHPYLMSALEEYRQYLRSMHRGADAEAVAREQESARRGIAEADCTGCTVSVNALREH